MVNQLELGKIYTTFRGRKIKVIEDLDERLRKYRFVCAILTHEEYKRHSEITEYEFVSEYTEDGFYWNNKQKDDLNVDWLADDDFACEKLKIKTSEW